MKKIIIITGASSGFGALTARALQKQATLSMQACARPGAVMRQRSKRRKSSPKDNDVDLRAIELDVSSQEIL